MSHTRPPRDRRAGALLLVYLILFAGVGYRLVSVQVVHADEYAARGEQQRAREIELAARRGRLYDRDGAVLATSVDAATIYADPRAFRPRELPNGLVAPAAQDPAAAAAALAPLLGVDAATLQEKLQRDAHFVYLARQRHHDVGQQVEALGLPGIGVIAEPTRTHPAGGLAAQVLGFTDIDGRGLAGLELSYDGLLTGRPGRLALERDPGGLDIASAERELLPPVPGTDLVLTIDREIQHVAERAAAAATEQHEALGAGIVVLDVATGEVLAMASTPGFDPDELASSDEAARRNRAVTDMFEPGSVQKAVTVAAAIESGVATPETMYTVPDRTAVGGKTFSDAHEHDTEELSLTEILARSSNVGAIQVGQQLGPERLASYLDRFGYGQPVGIDFPGEAAGAVLPVEDWSATSLPTIAIGHGVAVTLIQAAGIYATLANDGVAVQPRLVRGTVGADGRLAPTAGCTQPDPGGSCAATDPGPASRQVVSPETAQQVVDMLRGVVSDEHGTGSLAAVPGYEVAGKTGTARKPLEGARGYSSEYIASFVGFAPGDDPRIVVAVMVDEPTPIYGGVVAAPVFSEVTGFALRDLGIAPSDPEAADAAPALPPPPDPQADVAVQEGTGGGQPAGEDGAGADTVPGDGEQQPSEEPVRGVVDPPVDATGAPAGATRRGT